MNEIKIFENKEFGSVRTTEVDGKILFCGKDVAEALGYANSRKAVSDHCKGVTKQNVGVVTGKKADGSEAVQTVSMSFIPESDVYRLIVHSKLESAQKFESWVFDDVLPSIRKHGLYATDELLANPDLLISLATQLKEEREAKKALAEKNEKLLVELDESKEWYTVKRMEKLNPGEEFSWRLLKKESERMGIKLTKVFDKNYGEVNAYHRDVWESLYFDAINYGD